jgi:hypothetical protein
LEITDNNLSTSELIEIMHRLSELISLKICSLSLTQSRNFTDEEDEDSYLISEISKVTKINLEKMNEIEEVYFLMDLCSRMNYLQLDSIGIMDVQLFIKEILMKINDESNQYLRSLCFHIPTADDKIIQNLENMINLNKLLVDYTIKRVIDKVYLQWK